MSAVPKRKLTAAEYLAIEEKAEFKSEFYNGEMFAMAGAGWDHNQAKDNLIVELGVRLRGGPCRTISSDQRVLIESTGFYTYPDIVILCGPPEFATPKRDTLVNPTAIIEVLSPSTEAYDRGAKFRQYQQIPSLREYVMVAQEEPRIERYVRQADGSWVLTVFEGLEAEFALTTGPARVPMADVYRGVEFP
ncbi:MAG: Uma2 family endonuclease, partial [Fimbriiglobus sp.]